MEVSHHAERDEMFPFEQSALETLALHRPDMTKSLRTDADNGALRGDLRSNLRHHESRVVDIGCG